jgi:alcohol dehydrogenase (cytochrome c)
MQRTGRRECVRVVGTLLLLIVLTVGAAIGQQDLGAVTDDRLARAGDDPDNWITFGQRYENHRFADLAQIDTTNVHELTPVWIYQHGVIESTQPHPLVVDGILYTTTPGNDVLAMDAATGAPIWRYRHQFTSPQTGNQRGVAVAYGMVFVTTIDRRVIALDQETGTVVWGREIEGYVPPESSWLPDRPAPGPAGVRFRTPPVIYDGMVITSTCCPFGPVGNLDAFTEEQLALGRDPAQEWIHQEMGARGFILALDAASGDELWRFYLSPELGWEGTYQDRLVDGTPLERDVEAERALAGRYANAWAAAGISAFWTPAIDTSTGTLYFGTGDPEGPWPLARPGDNLYSNGMLALDAATGELLWFTQVVPHGDHHDLISQAILFDVAIDGGSVSAVGVGSKTGHFYAFDRGTGDFLFASEPFVRQINATAMPTPEGILVAPGTAGGMSVSPSSYDPTTGFVYVAAIDRPNTFTLLPTHEVEGHDLYRVGTRPVPVSEGWGTLSALDLRAGGSLAWQVRTPEPLQGGVLATAGGLVFMGAADGFFRAYDAATGEVLWSFQTGASIRSSAISYSVDGRQYVAVASGAAAPPPGVAPAPGALRPGGMTIAFALPRQP